LARLPDRMRFAPGPGTLPGVKGNLPGRPLRFSAVYRTRTLLPRKMRRPWIVIAAVAIVVVLVIGITQLGGTTPTSGGKAPALNAALRKLAGSPPPLAALHDKANQTLPSGQLQGELASLHGYPIVVNVWGSWCPPCRAEFPIFERVSSKVGKTVAFVGIATQDEEANSRKFLDKHPVTYPTYMDFDGSVRTKFGLLGTPSTIIYGRSGGRYLHQGPYRSDADLERDIRKYGA
jgi:cytochrome c biogenesis protein CcmG/thiol:disulfide interchange protein DsbE